ncbi:Uncharacterized protein BM_BM434 [Brugia malayi]|uniref:Bm434 n=1 Tax=Brugia malayi TaxID=6279 RepID=A0A0K0JE73_BRUMA|nr:Uncharacterized protein BM_BM434 [Brugia malayi]CDP95170.1 Bm434 [Brugia malayi]VIO92934.1 Uncharacterized protein BM_BM434 [Brugia malayi]
MRKYSEQPYLINVLSSFCMVYLYRISDNFEQENCGSNICWNYSVG